MKGLKCYLKYKLESFVTFISKHKRPTIQDFLLYLLYFSYYHFRKKIDSTLKSEIDALNLIL